MPKAPDNRWPSVKQSDTSMSEYKSSTGCLLVKDNDKFGLSILHITS